MDKKERALLVVSFGTAYQETREKTIEAVEMALKEAFPDYQCYRAWTSTFLVNKVKKETGLVVDRLEEALNRMAADGVREVLIQPTYIMRGIEYERAMSGIQAYVDRFDEVRVGTPLLSSDQDLSCMVDAMLETFKAVQEDEVLLLMGHGSPEGDNDCYHRMDRLFTEKGHANMRVGLVEAEPGIQTLIEELSGIHPRQIYLAPFMLVAGNHALRDMAGEGEHTWQSQLERAGYRVRCILQGLGEYTEVRGLFVQHAKNAVTWRQV